MGVTNVAYCWHSWTNLSLEESLRFYPGDRYVDWIGLSVYYASQARHGRELIRFARQHRKQVGILESGLGTESKDPFWDHSWEHYYGPLFRYVEANDIRLLVHNNFGDVFNQFSQPGDPFRNSRLDHLPQDIQHQIVRQIKTSRYKW